MSRVSGAPVAVPASCKFELTDTEFKVKGSKGELTVPLHNLVEVKEEDGSIKFAPRNSSKPSRAMAGTLRSLVNNAVVGANEGFVKKLTLMGVGYRVKSTGKALDLTLGFSHPVIYDLPEGVKAETPSQTEIVLSSADKQLLGQVAAEIRAFRPPEPYKGKGVRYSDERVRLKEAKKK